MEDENRVKVNKRLHQNQFVSARVKFEVYGEEMLEKVVKQSGYSGRVYLPPEWVGKLVKIIRIE